MLTTKYVVFDNVFAVVFPDALVHRDVAERLGRVAGQPTSAGFCLLNLDGDGVDVYGRSESLNLDSKPTDAQLLTRLIRGS